MAIYIFVSPTIQVVLKLTLAIVVETEKKTRLQKSLQSEIYHKQIICNKYHIFQKLGSISALVRLAPVMGFPSPMIRLLVVKR